MRDKLLHVRNTEPGQPLQLEDGEWDGLTFRKELIYADDFHKRNATSNQKFTIDEMKLAHWEHVGNQMIADGVKVPTPLKHTDSPEANRGQIIRYERDTNSKGVPALYGVVKFRDAEAAKLANSTDISIFVPETPFYNGKGKKYEYGIRHVALTDYPVIPGLEGFVPIAASFDEFDSEPLELGIGSVLKNNSNRLLGTQIAGETVGETAHTKGQHKAAAGLLGASAYFGGKEVKRIAGRFGKTAARQYKKGGIGRVVRSLGQFNKVTRIKPAAATAGVVSKVARAVGRRIPLVGLAGAAAGVGFGAESVKSGIQGVVHHASKIKNAPNKKRHTLSLEFKQMVQGLKQDLQLDFGQPERLELGGPGSGPQKGGLIKHNGLENRSVFDRIRMNVGKVKPHLQKIGRASVNIAKNVAKSPLTHIAVEGEIANQAARKIRGDDDNRRLSAIATTSGVRSVIKNAKAFVKYDQDAMKYADKAYGATKSSHTAFWGNKIKAAKAASSIHGAAAVLGTGLTSIAISKLLTKKKPKDKELSLGGPGSGPNAGQSRGMFRTAKKRINIAGKRIGRLLGRMGGEVDKSAGRFGAHAGATIGRVVGEQGAIATSRLARMAAPTVARGEGVNYLTKKIRGDDENRRAVSYVAQGAGMSALKSVGRNRKVAAAVAALTGASLLMKKRKKQELSLGGPGSGPNEGEKRGKYDKRRVAAGLVGALMSVGSAKDAVGLKTIYHGTSKEAAEKIKTQGLRPKFGGDVTNTSGEAQNWNKVFGSGDIRTKVNVNRGKGKAFVSSLRPVSDMFSSQYHGKDSDVVKMTISQKDFADKFHADVIKEIASGKVQLNNKDIAAFTQRKIPISQIHGSKAKLKTKIWRRLVDARRGLGTAGQLRGAAGVAVGAGLLAYALRKSKHQELSLGGPGSGPQKQSSVRDAEEGHFRKAHRYGLATIITPAATRLAISKLQKFKRFGGKSTIATALLGAGATGYAGYKSVKHNILGLKERYKRKKSLLPDMHNNIGSAILRELSLDSIDEHGNIHAGNSGRFVAKMDKDRSARSQRRNLTSLKPKKYHYEDIGTIPARENTESPREYKSRVRKLRNENKVENPNYYKDFSEEDVKSNPVASTHQGIKHAALTTVAATGAVGATAGAYAAGKSLVKEVQSQASRMSKKTDWKAKAAKANKELGTKRGALTRASKAGEAKVISAAKKSVLSAEAKATAMKILAEGTNTKTRTKVQLGKSILKAAHRILKNKNTKWRLLGVAAATAAAATGAHETKQHYDATQYHLGNVAKTLSDFKNSGLIKRQ